MFSFSLHFHCDWLVVQIILSLPLAPSAVSLSADVIYQKWYQIRIEDFWLFGNYRGDFPDFGDLSMEDTYQVVGAGVKLAKEVK